MPVVSTSTSSTLSDDGGRMCSRGITTATSTSVFSASSSACEGGLPSSTLFSAFFSSLYSTLDDVAKASNLQPYLRPDLVFVVGGDSLFTHSLIMAHFCRDLPCVQVKDEEGQGVLKMVVWVPTEIRVTEEAFKIFRKAIYLKELSTPDFDTWLMVRRLAKHYGCDMIMKKCGDVVPLSLTNCFSIFNKIPKISELKQRALEFIKANVKTLIDTGKSLEWNEKLWCIVLSSNEISPPVPSEDDLFTAALKWQEENKDCVDIGRFRLVFKGLFRYPLMTEEFLWSKIFRASEILEAGELIQIYSEKKGLVESNFDRTRRCASPDNDTTIDDTYDGFGLDNEYVWSLGSCHTSTQTDLIFTSTPLDARNGTAARFSPAEEDSSSDDTILPSWNERDKNEKSSRIQSQRRRRRSRSPSLLRKPTSSRTTRDWIQSSVSDSRNCASRPRPFPSIFVQNKRKLLRSGRLVFANSSSNIQTRASARSRQQRGIAKRNDGGPTALNPDPRRSVKAISHGTSSKCVRAITESDLNVSDVKYIPPEFLPRYLELLNLGCPPHHNIKNVAIRHKVNARVWPRLLYRMAVKHLPPQPTKCRYGLCGQTFTSVSETLNHEKMAHSRKIQKCYFCPKFFDINSYYVNYHRHLSLHTLERSFFCDRCGKDLGPYTRPLQHYIPTTRKVCMTNSYSKWLTRR